MSTLMTENINENKAAGFNTLWLHMTLIVNVLFLIMNYFVRVFPIGLNVGWTLTTILFYFLYNSKYSIYTKYCFFGFYLLWVPFYGIVCDYSTGILMYYAVLFALSILLFESPSTRKRAAFLALITFLSVIFIKTQVEPIVFFDNPIRTAVHFFVNFVVVYLAIWKFTADSESASRQKDELIKQINNKNAELERFAYITSHDLKQPVRNIVSFTGLLERNINQSNSKEKNLEYLEYIKSSSDSLDRLIDDILRMSKLDTSEFVNEDVDLNKVIDGVEGSMRQYIIDNNASIIRKKLPSIRGSKLFLNLLFQNLIENGIKYNKSEKSEIIISSREFGNNHIIEITDNGIGIAKEYFESVFQPFKRLHSNDNYNGSGLGLSICKKIVDIHNGEISITRSGTEGTQFKIRFPK